MNVTENAGIRLRIKLDGSDKELDLRGYYCSNPNCPCKDVYLYFYEADGRSKKKLFRITLNYETWEMRSSETFASGDDYPKMIIQFMSELNDEIKNWILSAKAELTEGDIIRSDIDYSDLKPSTLVYYSEIYSGAYYGQLIFQLDDVEYFVMDYYCPNPKCDCHDVFLTFHTLKNNKADASLLGVRLSFKTGKYTVKEKSAAISKEAADRLYRKLMGAFDGDGVKFFKARYDKIKKWGDEYLLPKLNISESFTAPVLKKLKIGRNAPCPCGSGKKYKNCCGDE